MSRITMELLHGDTTGRIIGAAMEVHSTLGCGYLEAVYQEALLLEFVARGIAFEAQPSLSLAYKGKVLNQMYRPDFIVEGKVVVELKALSRLTSTEEAQLINYLKGTGAEVGLLLNFGTKSLEWKRLVLMRKASRQSA